MLDVLESSEEKSLDYFNVQNLSFDHPLTTSEIDEFKTIIFSLNNLGQIYFKGSIDLKSIETVKNLLSISGFVDDSEIEKCIVTMFPRSEINSILSSNYINPSTWKLAYNVEKNNYLLADVPKCRELFSYVDRIRLLADKEELTNFEKVLRVYDIVKLFEYSSDDKSDINLPDIINDSKTSSKGFNKLFSFVLKELDINSFVGRVKLSDDRESYITAVELNDEKYGVNGIYLFDPSMDTLPKDTYKSDDIRMINYNYFGLLLSDIEYSSYGDSLTGALGILAIDDCDFSVEKRKCNKDVTLKKELDALDSAFGSSYEEIHNKVKTSSPIEFNTIQTAISNVYGKNKNVPNYDELVKENYFSRKSEIFTPKADELLARLMK